MAKEKAQKAKEKAEAKAKAEQEKKLKAKEKAESEAENAKEKIDKEAKELGIKKTRIKMAGFKNKDPDKLEKAFNKHKKLRDKRTVKRIEKAKINKAMKPVDKRRNLLKARLRSVKEENRAITYSSKVVEAWLEELNLIERSTKTWNKLTKNGTVNYIPGNKKKRTMKDILDSMDLDE